MNTPHNNIRTFLSKAEGFNVRAIQDDSGTPWFLATDIAKCLGYQSGADLARRVDPEDRCYKKTRSIDKNGKVVTRQIIVINESGLYAAIFGSNKPNAKKFKRFVTADVLPSIRKHGGYMVGQERFSDEFINATFAHMSDITRRALNHYDRLTERTHYTAFRNKAAAQAECERAVVATADQFGLSLKMAEIIADGKARRRA